MGRKRIHPLPKHPPDNSPKAAFLLQYVRIIDNPFVEVDLYGEKEILLRAKNNLTGSHYELKIIKIRLPDRVGVDGEPAQEEAARTPPESESLEQPPEATEGSGEGAITTQ
jgi:hypothetical protein